MTLSLRRATQADIDTAAKTLANAFADYEWLRWTVDAKDHERRIEGLQRLWLTHVGVPFGLVWLLEDGGARPVSVASWDVPGFQPARDVLAAMAPRVANLQGDRQHHAEIAEAIVVRLRPATPHYYLGAVGTLSDRQRRSYGSMVLEPVLTRAAEEGMDCYLETSSPGNVAFYERLGFVVLGEASVPPDGPHIWGMIRPGRPELVIDGRATLERR